VLAERCFHALDHDRVRFNDRTGRCAVASAGAAALGIGLCVLAAPEIVVGTVIVLGLVMVGVAIKEALDAYELRKPKPDEEQVEEFQEDRDIAAACGYSFVVGVSSAAHKEALLRQDPSLRIVVTGCKR
jgi:hypothetical protein